MFSFTFLVYLLFSSTELQQEASWVLINVSAGTNEQTQAVINSNVVEPLFQLVSSRDPKVSENAVWALSNIARKLMFCKSLTNSDFYTLLTVFRRKLSRLRQPSETKVAQMFARSDFKHLSGVGRELCYDGVGFDSGCLCRCRTPTMD